MRSTIAATFVIVGIIGAALAAAPGEAKAPAAPRQVKDIKAYCLDFNWGGRRSFARPGSWAGADPAAHVAWYKEIGANVIQTFCVSCNGYAWYKNGFVPEQPGLKHDFLPEVVKLGHAEGMMVMGYYCIAANAKWGTDHPDLSYGNPSTYHIPCSQEFRFVRVLCGHQTRWSASPAIDPFTSASRSERSRAGLEAAPMLRVNASA